MAIQTSIKRSFIYWNLLYLVLTGGLGIWGAYDYWVTIPAREEAVQTYTGLVKELATLEIRGKLWTLADKRQNKTITADEKKELEEIEASIREGGFTQPPPRLSEAERARYLEIKDTLTKKFENTPPEPPASYDAWVNLWVYFVGCGILGAPWFLWKLVSRRGKTWILQSDGSLSAPQGTFTADQITDIDMSIWMRKSVARVTVEGQVEPIVLDDYEYQDAFRIVGSLAHRFYPEEWTEEAKPTGETEEETEE